MNDRSQEIVADDSIMIPQTLESKLNINCNTQDKSRKKNVDRHITKPQTSVEGDWVIYSYNKENTIPIKKLVIAPIIKGTVVYDQVIVTVIKNHQVIETVIYLKKYLIGRVAGNDITKIINWMIDYKNQS